MSDDFSNYPKSVTHIRADKSDSAADWTARDAVIEVLRQMDKGEIVPDAIVICMRESSKPGSVSTFFRASSPDPHITYGLLFSTLMKIVGSER